MVRIQLDASAALRAQARDPKYVTTATDGDLPRGVIELPGYPRAGDEIEWPDTGMSFRVERVCWMVGTDMPIVILS